MSESEKDVGIFADMKTQTLYIFGAHTIEVVPPETPDGVFPFERVTAPARGIDTLQTAIN